MRFNLIISTLLILASCNLKGKQDIHSNKNSSTLKVDTLKNKLEDDDENSSNSVYDSLAKAPADTSTMKGKREWIMNHFLIENGLTPSDYDTLFDLNYDGFKDYVIGFYGKAGSGINNRVEVFFYHSQKNYYSLNEALSGLPNPTFYINLKKITGFYLGHGGGGGGRLEWINGKWTTTKEFEVDNQGDTSKWEISYPLKGKNETIIRPFQMIPPADILETEIKL